MAESSNHWSDAELREKAIAEVLAQVQGLEYDRCDIEAALRHRESMDSEIVCCVEAVEDRLRAEQQRDQARELLRLAEFQLNRIPSIARCPEAFDLDGIAIDADQLRTRIANWFLAPPAADAKERGIQ
jgi:hypothetical protein